ncbi:MAG: metallophosphoesterase [Polyangiaceae bacterium]
MLRTAFDSMKLRADAPSSVSVSESVRESLLIFSDVHLGSDLNDRQPKEHAVRRSSAVDRDLVRMLDHYRATPPKGDRWHLVIAGDLIDFIGITIDPKDAKLDTELSPEELAHGVGSSADHVRFKLQRVAERHWNVFAALAAFVAEGHALTIVHGNHDLEFHWDAVKTEFKAILANHAKGRMSEPNVFEEGTFTSRIEFNPWFFYRGGVAYVEHGHQYDPYCATENVMAPISPRDPRRTVRGFSDILLRYVVRPTRGLTEHGHENYDAFDYIRFGLRLGVGGALSLAKRFVVAIVELFRLRQAHFSEAAAILREEHERRMALLAEATRIGIDRMRALAALQAPPVTKSIHGILASVLLDKISLSLASVIALVVCALVSARLGHFVWAGSIVLVTWAVVHRYLTNLRKIDPAEAMLDRAAHLSRLFPAAFVVMGHTHVPVQVPAGRATYINLGSWAEEEPEVPDDPRAYRAARTHLVIHVGDDGPVAELFAWDPETGPRRFFDANGTVVRAPESSSPSADAPEA